MVVESLLSLSVRAFAHRLCYERSLSRSSIIQLLKLLPEFELAKSVWMCYLQEVEEECCGEYQQLVNVARAFASVFWQPLQLRINLNEHGWQALELICEIGTQLQHLELQGSFCYLSCLTRCLHLRCLCLRGSCGLVDADFEALSSLPALQALDVAGLTQLTDAASFPIARIARLSQLNISDTAMTDNTMQALTYGQKLHRWEQQQGASHVLFKNAWPALPLTVLRAAGTRLTVTGLQYLHDLPSMLLLDVRRTGIQQAALQPLKQRFALHVAQGPLLASSNVLAAAVVNFEVVACCCARPGALNSTEQWAEQGAQLLLHANSSNSVQCLLEKHAALVSETDVAAVQPASAAVAHACSAKSRRRHGFRVSQRGRGIAGEKRPWHDSD